MPEEDIQNLVVKQFRAERLDALSSLDEAKICAYMDRWGIVAPGNPKAFWEGVHKARTAMKDLPLEDRLLSKRWLVERGFHSLDDGDSS